MMSVYGKDINKKIPGKASIFSYLGPGQYEDIFGFSKIES